MSNLVGLGTLLAASMALAPAAAQSTAPSLGQEARPNSAMGETPRSASSARPVQSNWLDTARADLPDYVLDDLTIELVGRRGAFRRSELFNVRVDIDDDTQFKFSIEW